MAAMSVGAVHLVHKCRHSKSRLQLKYHGTAPALSVVAQWRRYAVAGTNHCHSRAWLVLKQCCLADSVMPSLSCKGAIVVELGTSEPLTTGATDISGTTTVSCESDTADLPVGADQQVVCTAKDASGNEAECTVNVSVVGAFVRPA